MSQASKFLKIQSLESGSFTPSKNIVTFELPTNATYDLNQSYIILDVQPNIVPIEIDTDANGNPLKGFLPYFLTHQGLETNAVAEASMTGINGVLVRNSRFYSDRLGRLEDIRNSNQIMNYMSYFKHSIDEQTATGYYSVLSPPSDVNIFDRYNSKLEKKGGTLTNLNKPFQWQVPLKEFINLGTMQSFNTTNMGNVRIQVELDLAKVGAITYCNLNNDALHFGSASNLQINDIDGVFATITKIVTSNKLGLDLAKSPYFVGQVIRVFATPTETGGVAEPAAIDESAIIITDIKVITDVGDPNLGCLELTLSRSLGSLIAGQSYTAVVVSGSTEPGGYFGNTFFDFQSAELRLKQIPMVPMNELTYITITNESDNGLGLPVFNKQYFLEPECIGFVLICSGDVPFVGGNGTVVSFRLAVDNVDVVGNRDVIDDLNNGIQYDLLNKLFLNLGIPLKNTMQRAMRMDEIFTDNTQLIGGQGALTFVGSPTSQTPTMKILNVSLTGSTQQGDPGIQGIQLYKFLVKNVKL